MIKSLLIWSLVLSVTFAAFIAAVYYSKDRLFPKTAQPEELPVPGLDMPADSTSRAKIDSLTLVIDALLMQLQEQVEKTRALEDSLANRKVQIEQLTAANAEIASTKDSLEQQIKVIKATEIKVEDLTKTLGAMKLDVLKPIVGNLPDEVIRILYDRAKAKDKQKIFSALPAKRASQILKHMTKKLN